MINDNKIKKVWNSLLSLSIIFFSFSVSAQTGAAQEKWVDSVFAILDLDQKIGQLLMVQAYAGGNSEHYQAIEELVRDYSIGGIVFLQGGPVAQAKLTNDLQDQSRIPLLIAMDVESGLGMHLDSTIIFPQAMSLGAIENDTIVYDAAHTIGKQLRLLGVHMNFAPVVDINTNSSNPVIGMRAFSDDPEVVAEKSLIYSRGLSDAGILPVIKHFPGHGDTEMDSHLGLPVLKASREVIYEREFYPFRKFVEQNTPAIMAGHVYAPNIINDGLPASLSPNFLKNIIRKEWKYDGLVVSDALNMGAISENFKKGQAEEFALIAGNDILLFPENIPATVRRIKRAVRKGTYSEDELNKSVKRILTAKYKAGLAKYKPTDTANLIFLLNHPDEQLQKRNILLNSVTLVKNEKNLLPIENLEDKNFAILNIGQQNATVFTHYLKKYASFQEYDYSDATTTVVNALGFYDLVVVGLFSNKIREEEMYHLETLQNQTNVIIAVFGSPYKLERFSNFKNIIWVPDQTELSQELTPQLIFGAEEFQGHLPITAGIFERGSGITTKSLNRLAFSIPEAAGIDGDYLRRIDEIAKETIQQKMTPGFQVLIARHGKVVWEKNYGYQTYDSIIPVDDFTIYDLASITKVAASVQALMFLYERGLIDLDKKISFYLPDLEGTNKENMILRDILTHQAGLWPYLPFYKSTMIGERYLPEYYSLNSEIKYLNQVCGSLYASEAVKDSVWQWVKESKVREKNRREPYDYKYSDMGYYIIHRLSERLMNQPMDEFLNQNLYNPMGMTTMGYHPLCSFPLERIAPTENDTYFRFGLVAGYVHDQGAAMLGGVAGHAGLFSNALDLAKLMQLMLQKGNYGGKNYFKPETIELFTQKQYESNRRGLGWDKPVTDEYGGPTSEYSSGDTFGHTGFTGTAAWVDPQFDLVYIFLSNRIHPDALNTKLISTNVRTRIQDIIYQALFKEIQYKEIQ